MLFSINSYAQLDAKQNHYMFNGMAFNPATAGSKESISATMLYRTQYMGFGGGPKTTMFNIHAPIQKLKGGLGLGIINDEVGSVDSGRTTITSTQNISLNYAYRRPFGSGTIAIGPSIGFIQRRSSAKYDARQPNDPILQGIADGNLTGSALDLGLGALYQQDKLYVGLSLLHLTMPKYKLEGQTLNGRLPLTAFLTAGYTYQLNEDITLQPTMLFKSAFVGNTTQFDLSCIATIKNKFWGGVAYTSADAFVTLVGLNITEKIRAGIAYDFTTSRLRNYSTGTVELFLNYDFTIKIDRPQYIIRSPRFL